MSCVNEAIASNPNIAPEPLIVCRARKARPTNSVSSRFSLRSNRADSRSTRISRASSRNACLYLSIIRSSCGRRPGFHWLTFWNPCHQKILETRLANRAVDVFRHIPGNRERCARLFRFPPRCPQQLDRGHVEVAGQRQVDLHFFSGGDRLDQRPLQVGRTCNVDVAFQPDAATRRTVVNRYRQNSASENEIYARQKALRLIAVPTTHRHVPRKRESFVAFMTVRIFLMKASRDRFPTTPLQASDRNR